MPYIRMAESYTYAVVAGGSLFLSGAAAAVNWFKAPTQHVLYAVGESPFAIDQSTLIAVVGFAGSLSAVAIKTYVDWRDKRRTAALADLAAFEEKLASASEELGDTKSQLKTAKADLAAALTRIDQLTKELSTERHRVNNVAQTAQVASQVANAALQVAVENKHLAAAAAQEATGHESRIAELEHHVGSSDSIDIPPPASPPTN